MMIIVSVYIYIYIYIHTVYIYIYIYIYTGITQLLYMPRRDHAAAASAAG